MELERSEQFYKNIEAQNDKLERKIRSIRASKSTVQTMDFRYKLVARMHNHLDHIGTNWRKLEKKPQSKFTGTYHGVLYSTPWYL